MADAMEILELKEELDSMHQQLRKFVCDTATASMGFGIEGVSLKDEASVLAEGFSHIPVTTLTGNQSLGLLISAWSTYFVNDDMSTRFVYRLPGMVVVPYNEAIQDTVLAINTIKGNIAFGVRRNRSEEQRHEFIHELFPRIMTEQLYRKIPLMTHDVKNAWFNWTRRPVPRAYTKEQAIEFVISQRERPRTIDFPHLWEAKMDALAQDIREGRFSRYQRYKLFKALPTVTLNVQQADGQYRRVSKNATTPIILMGQRDNMLPKYSELGAYTAPVEEPSLALSSNKMMVDGTLRLVGVVDGRIQ